MDISCWNATSSTTSKWFVRIQLC